MTLALGMVTGAFLSGSVEVAQLFVPMRICSFIDLVTNTFGATVGSLIGWPWVRLVWPVLSIRLRQRITMQPLVTCAFLTGGVLFLVAIADAVDLEPRLFAMRRYWTELFSRRDDRLGSREASPAE